MKRFLKYIIQLVRPIFDWVFAPLTLLGAIYFWFLKRGGLRQLPISRAIFHRVGMFPLVDHYYEPLFNPRHLTKSLDQPRALPGIDFNDDGQLAVLKEFRFNEELSKIPIDGSIGLAFQYHNGSYTSGDAEFLYNIVRARKPRRIIEIGCGQTTKLIQQATAVNAKENPAHGCEHICVEPFENPWLEQLAVKVHRSKVEDLPLEFFSRLEAGDILFIDSSHVVRPQGDCVFEYLQLLPSLKKGVLVHVHDIFTPRDYPFEWIIEEGRIWTEQYLLEAFLSHNNDFRIIGAVNYLFHHHRAALEQTAPVLAKEPDREPGAFWMEKVR